MGYMKTRKLFETIKRAKHFGCKQRWEHTQINQGHGWKHNGVV